MWNTVVSTMVGSTNYRLMNMPNLYNFLIVTLQGMDDAQKQKFIENFIILIGNSTYDDFKIYLFKKQPKSELLSFLPNN